MKSHLKSKSPRAALQFSDDLKRLRQALSRFPEMGRITEEIPVPRRTSLRDGPYLVDYEIQQGAVVIFAIRHGGERSPGVEVDDDLDFENPDGDPRFS
ncbi:type II toxin-antitoxin system RelE/ParE family toxin [Rhizobium sp. LjRoot258]|uniref:type II toxin-antitoxin system RelE/ParE family toxin n=1 Tax=Rhizobium sp. LjRoot258 TaxID=3342299 RepID=UPI003ED050F6